MSLNLKNPRAYELAHKLARLTGESLTTAVIEALEERLKRVSDQKSRATKAERILSFGDRFARGMPSGCSSADHAPLLYGDDGLPK